MDKNGLLTSHQLLLVIFQRVGSSANLLSKTDSAKKIFIFLVAPASQYLFALAKLL